MRIAGTLTAFLIAAVLPVAAYAQTATDALEGLTSPSEDSGQAELDSEEPSSAEKPSTAEEPSGTDDEASAEEESDGETVESAADGCGEGEVRNPETGNCEEDRDCPDFSSQEEAQRFFESRGGPEQDPHRLDEDPGEDDGRACESLPSESAGGGSGGGGDPRGGIETGYGGAADQSTASRSGEVQLMPAVGGLVLMLVGLLLGAVTLRRHA